MNMKGKNENLNFMSSLVEFKMIVAVGVLESIDKFDIYLTFMTLFLREVILRVIDTFKNPKIWANNNQTLLC